MSEAFVERVASGVDDVGRCIEIRLPNLQMDNVTPFCLQRSCLHQNFEGGLGAQTRHTLRETKFAGFMHGTDYARTKSSLNHQYSTFRAKGAVYQIRPGQFAPANDFREDCSL